MKTPMKTLMISAFAAAALSATTIPATKVSGDLSSASVKFAEAMVYPQVTIGNNDKVATQAIEKAQPKKVMIGAVYNDKEIKVVVKWADGTKNVQPTNSTTLFGDGFAVQFPQSVGDLSKLPYIGMGSEGRPVAVHLKKAVSGVYEPNGNGNVELQQHKDNWNLFKADLAKRQKEVASLADTDYTKTFVAQGFRSTTEVRDAKGVKMTMAHSGKEWTGTLVRPLKDGTATLKGSVIPVAVALWDGADANRDGAKLLSSWMPIQLDAKGKEGASLVAKQSKGDVAKGKQLADENCAACHIYPGSSAMPNMAPNLTHIGGYANYSYLKESILAPNAAIVPGYNRNAHPSTPWYNVTDGKRESTMPPYEGVLNDAQVEDLIAFLQSLKGGKK